MTVTWSLQVRGITFVPFEDKLVIMGGGGEPSDVGSDVIPLSNGFCNGISCNGIKHSRLVSE
jgi:hypothetical protein